MWTVQRIQSLQTDFMSSAYFCSYYVVVCPYQFSASSKEVFLIAYKGTIFFFNYSVFSIKKWFLWYSCWFLFSWLLVLFCRTTSLILLINRLMGQIYLKDSLDLINKVKPKSVIRPQCSKILAIALFPNRFGLKWKLKQINIVKLIIFYHLCSYLCTQIYNQKGIFYVQIRITQRITPSFKKDNIIV